MSTTSRELPPELQPAFKALAVAMDRVPREAQGKTYRAAVLAIFTSIASIEDNMRILEWEAGRVAREAEQREARAKEAERLAKIKEAAIAKIERKKAAK